MSKWDSPIGYTLGHAVDYMGRKKACSPRAKKQEFDRHPFEEKADGKKPFGLRRREEMVAYAKEHITFKSRTSVERQFPGFYYAAKNHEGLIDELFPMEKQRAQPREKRNWKGMPDDALIAYFQNHYAGDVMSWSGEDASLKKLDRGLYMEFVVFRGLDKRVTLCGEPAGANGI
ncbi:Uncharacterised protein [uncultured archaeon]|nr:Uncharacterised protein [uncultured archaeon]